VILKKSNKKYEYSLNNIDKIVLYKNEVADSSSDLYDLYFVRIYFFDKNIYNTTCLMIDNLNQFIDKFENMTIDKISSGVMYLNRDEKVEKLV